MITGTVAYTAEDLRLIETALGSTRPTELWKAALVMSLLGAVVGFGVAGLAAKLFGDDGWLLSAPGAWGALVGAIALVTAGAWRISRLARTAPPQRTQAIALSEDGIRLTTDKADSLMRWPLFTRRADGPDFVGLLTEDNTWVLLRPRYFANPADHAAALRLVEEYGPKTA